MKNTYHFKIDGRGKKKKKRKREKHEKKRWVQEERNREPYC
jgi:hypothetical protein